MKDNVIVSTGYGRLHLYYAAHAAQDTGLLHSMLTSFYLKRKWIPLVKQISKLSQKPVWRRLLLRRSDKIIDQKVVSLPSTEVITKLFTLTRKKVASEDFSYWLERMESLYYGRMANIHIKPPVKLIHSRSGFSRAIIPHAHKIGAKVLLEQSAAHPEFSRKILEPEYEKWGIAKKYRSYITPAKEMGWDIEHSDYVLTNSNFCADTIKPYIVNPDKIRVVYTGVDTEVFKVSRPKTNSKFKILFVGSLSTSKGVVYLIKAFKKLALHNAELVLVGGKHFDRPKEVDQLSNYYTHIPPVAHSKIPGIFADSDIFVFPSLSEGSALVVGEAMASSLACIVTPNAGSIINDGIDGFIVPLNDVNALAEKILHLYKNRELIIQMGRAARETAVNHLTWKNYQKNMVRVYKDISGH